MATLTGKKISDTYKDLLQISNNNTGIDGSLRTVEDGEGTTSPLQVSSSAVNISNDGVLQLNGTAVTSTAAELNILDGADSSINTLVLPDNTTISTFGASLIDDADAASARTTLNVDVAGTDNSTDVSIAAGKDYISIDSATQVITLGTVDISDDTNLTASTGITLTDDTLTTNDSEIVHDNLNGYSADKHVAHSSVTLTAGTGLTGGGDITASREFAVDTSVIATKSYVDTQVGTVNTLDELTDTNITNPVEGALLKYDSASSKWIDSNEISGGIFI